MSDFFNMGGYGSFVWSAYGLAAVIFIWNIGSARRAHRNALARAERAIAMAAANQNRRQG